MKKAGLSTYGCKLNQYETQLIMEQISDEYEFGDTKEKCDLYIINSCSVTAKAAKESRQSAKKAYKLNPNAKIIYTGCDSYLVNSLPAVIVGNSYKQNIKSAIERTDSDIKENTKTYPLNSVLNGYKGRSRAFIKIQEGCNNHCTYCVIPKLRGRERDKPANLVLEEIEKLSGFGEIVLSGTNIGSYKSLKKLLIDIDKLDIKTRIRISSIEPMYVDNELIDIIASGKFAKHLHIPLQSGSDKVLRLMGRHYSKKRFEEIVDRCAQNGIFVGTDVIVGFFGETEREFMETYDFIKDLALSFGHVFSYSKRPYTSAVNIKTFLEKGPVVKKRNAALKKLFDEKSKESMRNMVGKDTSIVIEPTIINKNGKNFHRSISSQYFPVLVDSYKKGLIETTVKSFDGEYAYA